MFGKYLLVCTVAVNAIFSNGEEPRCYSRFDFEEKLLEKMVELTHNMKILETKVEKKLGEVEMIANDLDEKRNRYEKGLRNMEKELKHDYNHKMSNFEKRFAQNVEDSKSKVSNEIKTNQDILSKTVADMSQKITEIVDQTEQQVARLSADFTALTNGSLQEDLKNMEREIKHDFNRKMSDIEKRFAQDVADTKTQVSNEIHTNQEILTKTVSDMSQKITEVIDQTEQQVQEVKDLVQGSIKPSVAFVARTVSDRSPGFNTKLVFTNAVLNTDNSYNTGTGEFIAPVSGLYLFTAQLCGQYQKYVTFRIVVNDKTMSETVHYDHDASNTCTSSSTVAFLDKDGRAFVQTGSGLTTRIQDENVSWNMFVGVLIN